MRVTRLLVLAAFLSAACSSGAAGVARTGEDVVVGVPLAITGVQAGEGALTRQGDDMWQRWANRRGGIDVGGVRHRVRLRYADDHSQPDLSAEVTQRLVTEGAQFLLGPYGSPATAADALVADRDGILMVEGGGSAQAIFEHGYRYVFGVASPAGKHLLGVLDMAATLNPKPTSIALLSANDSFSQEVAGAVEAYAADRGFQVVSRDVYPAGSADLAPYVAHARTRRADIVLNAGHLPEALAVNRAVKALRLDAKLFAYTVGPATSDFVGQLGPDADYVFDGSDWTPDVRYTPTFGPSVSEFVADYERTYRTRAVPDYHVAQATAAGLTLQRAIEDAGSMSPDDVRYSLEGLNVMTFFGQIKFDSRGLNIYRTMVVEQVQDGTHHAVWPPSLATARPRYPTPSWAAR